MKQYTDTKHTELRSDCGKYKLRASIDSETQEYYYATLTVPPNDCWDNPPYLIKWLYSAVKHGTRDRDINRGIPLGDYHVVLQLLEKGIELGFFKYKEFIGDDILLSENKPPQTKVWFSLISPRGSSTFDLLAYQGSLIHYNGDVVGRVDEVDVKTDGRVVITTDVDPAYATKHLGSDLVLRDSPDVSSESQAEWFLLPKGASKQGPFTLTEIKNRIPNLKSAQGIKIRRSPKGDFLSFDSAAALHTELERMYSMR